MQFTLGLPLARLTSTVSCTLAARVNSLAKCSGDYSQQVALYKQTQQLYDYSTEYNDNSLRQLCRDD